MEIKDGGMVIIKGDNIENGGIKIVHNHGEERANGNEPLTEDELKEKVANVCSRIKNKRQWFPVCKYMMWRKMVAEGDFKSAVNILERLYPELDLNPDDLSVQNVQSFSKTLDKWNPEDAPVQGKTFSQYYTIAELMDM